MDIFVPPSCTGNTIMEVLGQVFDENGLLLTNQYTFDLSELEQLDTLGAITLNNLIAWLEEHEVTVHVEMPRRPLFEDSSLFFPEFVSAFVSEALEPKASNPADEPESRWTPLRAHVHPEENTNRIVSRCTRWLAEQVKMSTLVIADYLDFLDPLIQYVFVQGQAGGAFIHAEVKTKSKELHINVAHYGKEIPHVVRSIWDTSANDAVVLAKALEKRTGRDAPGRSSESPLGFLLDDVIFSHQGRLSLYSGFGMMKCKPSALGVIQQLELSSAYYPGALFEITIDLETSGLLSRINEPVAGPGFQLV